MKKSFISTSIGEDCISVKSIGDILTSIENMSKPSLSTLAISHGIKNIAKLSLDHLKNILSDHICSGCCLNSTFEGCIQVMSIFDDNVLDESISHVEESDNTLLIFMLSYFQPKIKLRPLRRLLTRHKIVFSLQHGLSCLRRKLKTFIRTLKKGKSRYEKIKSQLAKEMKAEEEIENHRSEIHQSWPQFVPLALKKKNC